MNTNEAGGAMNPALQTSGADENDNMTNKKIHFNNYRFVGLDLAMVPRAGPLPQWGAPRWPWLAMDMEARRQP